MRQEYVLDFSATPLEASAGGQFHKVTVDPDGPRDLADTEVHESIEAAISHLILSHELVGGTETFTPLAKVQVWGTGGCRMYEIQAPPPCEAPDYVPLRLPREAEILAAFPKARSITVSVVTAEFSFGGEGCPQVDFRVQFDAGSFYVDAGEDGVGTLPSRHSDDWVRAVRSICLAEIERSRKQVLYHRARAQGLAAAVEEGSETARVQSVGVRNVDVGLLIWQRNRVDERLGRAVDNVDGTTDQAWQGIVSLIDSIVDDAYPEDTPLPPPHRPWRPPYGLGNASGAEYRVDEFEVSGGMRESDPRWNDYEAACAEAHVDPWTLEEEADENVPT